MKPLIRGAFFVWALAKKTNYKTVLFILWGEVKKVEYILTCDENIFIL